GVAVDPTPRCVILEFNPQYVQYGALVWLTRPGMEYLDLSGVRTRIVFALSRIGAPLESISQVIDLQHAEGGHDAGEAEETDRMAAVGGVEVFQSLTPDEKRRLAAGMTKVSFAAGEVILRQGEEGDSLYVLRRGRVRILLANEAGLSEQVAILEPGDFFGEMSLLTGAKRTATAVAVRDVDCYHLAKSDMQSLLDARPSLA